MASAKSRRSAETIAERAYAGSVTRRSAPAFRQYAGAWLATRSDSRWLRPGVLVEFGRQSGPEVWIQIVDTGEAVVVPAGRLSVEPIPPDGWRVSQDGEPLLEVEPPPRGYQPRSFAPPWWHRLRTWVLGPRWPWPDPPTQVSLVELVREP